MPSDDTEPVRRAAIINALMALLCAVLYYFGAPNVLVGAFASATASLILWAGERTRSKVTPVKKES